MKSVGAIDEAIFSMSIAPGEKQSKITFGGYLADDFATTPVKWHDVQKNSDHWALGLDEMSVKVKGK